MRQPPSDGRVVPYPRVKRFLEAAIRVTNRKPMIHGLLEVDVTKPRAFLRDHQARAGESLSFTAFIMACLGTAVDEHKDVHAMRKGSHQLIVFEDVDVLTYIEREAGDQQLILPYIVRAANHKTFLEIHREIRAAQVQDLAKFETGGGLAMRLLPAAFFLPYFQITTWIGRHYPRLWKKTWGTVMLSAVGMFGEGAGWGIPLSPPSLCWITVGGIGVKRERVDTQTVTREFLSLTVSFDHSLIDGAPAARFTRRFKELIESGHGLIDDASASDRMRQRHTHDRQHHHDDADHAADVHLPVQRGDLHGLLGRGWAGERHGERAEPFRGPAHHGAAPDDGEDAECGPEREHALVRGGEERAREVLGEPVVESEPREHGQARGDVQHH